MQASRRECCGDAPRVARRLGWLGVDQFTQLVADAPGWAYAIIFVLALLDAIVPVVPSETSVITAGVVAASGDLSVPLIVAAAAAGAFAGDNTAYLLGRRFGRRIEARFFRGERGGEADSVGRAAARRAGRRADRDRSFHPRRTDCGDAQRGDAGVSVAPVRVVRRSRRSGWALYATLLGYFGGSLRGRAVEGASARARDRVRRGGRGRADALVAQATPTRLRATSQD